MTSLNGRLAIPRSRAAREAEKYENPIPSRELILQHLGERGSPAAREELVEEFGLESDEDIEALRRRLRAMERDGQLIYTRRGTYAPVDKLDLVCGRVSGHRDGFGFLIPDDGSDDLFLSPAQMRSVFDGDRCLARVAGLDRRGRREGAIVEVISRAHESIVGRYHIESDVGFVVPDNPKIQQEVLVTPGRALDAAGSVRRGEDHSLADAALPAAGRYRRGDRQLHGAGHGDRRRAAQLRYSARMARGGAQEAARLKPEVEERTSTSASTCAICPSSPSMARMPATSTMRSTAKPGGWKLLTGGFRLYVAIADVSHYVKVDSALDKEAVVRGNSVYFPERVVPMLPEELSNGLCSLNPHVDRLAMVCEITLSKSGKMTDYQFYEAVIHSHARLTYNKVSAMLEQPKSAEGKRLSAEYAEVLPHLKQLYSLYKVLLKARHTRGAIDFETQETRIVFGADRKIAAIKPTERNDAHKLIEECMLCANVATAAFLQKHEIPALYRVHDAPPLERQEKLRAFLGELGLSRTRARRADARITGRCWKDPGASGFSRDPDGDAALAEPGGLQCREPWPLRSELRSLRTLHFADPALSDLLVHRAIRSVIRSRRDTPHVRREGAPSMPRRASTRMTRRRWSNWANSVR